MDKGNLGELLHHVLGEAMMRHNGVATDGRTVDAGWRNWL